MAKTEDRPRATEPSDDMTPFEAATYFFHAFTLARAQRLGADLKLYSERAKIILVPTAPLKLFVPFASMEHTDQLIETSYKHTKRFLAGQLESKPEPFRDPSTAALH